MRRESTGFVETERKKVELPDPAGERLGDPFGESEVLGACEDEAPRRGISVHRLVKVGEQSRGPLHLIEDGALRVLAKEAPGILDPEVADVEGFEGHIRQFRKSGLTQRRLAGLPRTGHGHHGHAFGERAQMGGEVPRNHTQIVNHNFNLHKPSNGRHSSGHNA